MVYALALACGVHVEHVRDALYQLGAYYPKEGTVLPQDLEEMRRVLLTMFFAIEELCRDRCRMGRRWSLDIDLSFVPLDRIPRKSRWHSRPTLKECYALLCQSDANQPGTSYLVLSATHAALVKGGMVFDSCAGSASRFRAEAIVKIVVKR